MKKRNPLAVVGLSIITLGIYDLYWLAVTRKELNAKTSNRVPSIWLLISPAVLLFVGYILIIASASSSTNNASTTGSSLNVAAIIGLIIVILAGIAATVISIIWFFKFSKAINEYTAGKMSTAVTFLVLWLIHLIGVALIQDAFNDMTTGMPVTASAGAVPPQPVAPMPGSPTMPVMPGAPVAPGIQPNLQPPTPAVGGVPPVAPPPPPTETPGSPPPVAPSPPTVT